MSGSYLPPGYVRARRARTRRADAVARRLRSLGVPCRVVVSEVTLLPSEAEKLADRLEISSPHPLELPEEAP